jgi:hypothetical protein
MLDEKRTHVKLVGKFIFKASWRLMLRPFCAIKGLVKGK